ncbi:hypothetical protein LIER_08986 [Lithospermum erythrorhizon]|uniref:BED-type domain-containing protein n=1 Tax=Lithospermum erythrorhizon TaxID=34254 RepID=A0AAV3PE62_LITER
MKMEIPEKISEALIQTDLNMKSFRKSMLVLLFEWQNLETRLDLTQKCFKETFPLQQDSASQTSTQLIEKNLDQFEQKERNFREFQENGFREMEIRENKLGFIRKEICLREKRVEEQEGVIELEKKQIEFQRKSINEGFKKIGEKEKYIEECLREIEIGRKENQCKEEEFAQRVKEFEFKEREFQALKRDLEFNKKEGNSKGKLIPSKGSAVFRIAGPSNQSMALVNVSETSPGNHQFSNGRLRSKAWLHFTRISKGVGSAHKCKCNYCHRIFTLCGGGTSQLLRHISEGRCPAYQKRLSALPIDETLSQLHTRHSVHVQIEEPLRPSNDAEDSRTALIKGCEDSVKQEPATILLEPELQTQPHVEPQMPIPDIQNAAISDYSYQPQQLKDLSKDQSDPSVDQPPLRMGNSLENSDNIIRIGDSDQYCQETQINHKGNSNIYENASGDSSDELQMFNCEVEMPCYSGDQRSQNRKREREHIIEQNESSNVFLHSDIDDLSSPLRKHRSSNLSTGGDENTEDVLHEVDPVSCIIPIDPAQEIYGHMVHQKDLTHEGSMPE